MTISFYVYGGVCGNSLPVRFTVHERTARPADPVAEATWGRAGDGVITFDGLTPDTEYVIRTGSSWVTVYGRTAAEPASCTATVKIDNTWNGGFVATVAVRNAGAARLDGWRVSLPGFGDQKKVIWNAVEESDAATVTVRNAAYNAVVAAGGVTTFGMVVWSGAVPADLTATCGR
ncbi:MAG TPA: cellulose binding domain-containing protein [Actinoplanes sp.]|nr:cellulose binding domain-containing protein [Actinoplanes sp.]